MERFGPLAALIGEWEGDEGLDLSYHHAVDEVVETRYREKASFKPFGPVDNGDQHLYGLDYKAAMWRGDEEDPFHTELGYWMWCDRLGHVMRGFLIPRAVVLLAGGEVAADATSFHIEADAGHEAYGILSNPYLLERAKTVRYELDVTTSYDTFSYKEDSVLTMTEVPGEFHHTDSNTLHRVASYDLPPVD